MDKKISNTIPEHDEKKEKYNRHCKNEVAREKRRLSMQLRSEDEWDVCDLCEKTVLKKDYAKHENSKKHLKEVREIKKNWGEDIRLSPLGAKLKDEVVEREPLFIRRRLD